ncbi:MAG: T9SS type A sorting domain-containing protein [Flavobacteriales bacterium]|jgi:hypothetical protein
MKRLLLLVSTLALWNTNVSAQNPVLTWAQRFGGTSNDKCTSAVVSEDGCTVSVGSFSGSITINVNGTDEVFTSLGLKDILITKLNSSGTVLWVKQFGGNGNDEALQVAKDASNNVFITGFFNESVIFSPSAALSSAGASDLFITKLNSNGEFQWVNSVSNTGADVGRRVKLDNAGNIFVTGESITGANSNIILNKYDANGTLLWAKTIGAAGNDFSNALEINAEGNVFLTGNFSGTVTFEASSSTVLSSVNATDAFLAQFTNDGSLVWIKQMAGANSSSGVTPVDIAFDHNNSLILVGNFSGTANFDTGNNMISAIAAGVVDVFMINFSLTGERNWIQSFGGAFNDQVIGLTIDTEDNFYLTGIINNSCDFDPSGNSFILSSDGSNDAFVAKYAGPGEFQWAERHGSINADFGMDVTMDPSGDLIVVGTFTGAGYFGPEGNQELLLSAGGEDIFILTYDVCHPVTHALSLDHCGAYEWNGILYTESGEYTQQLIGAGGCDSTVVLTLHVDYLDPIVDINNNILTVSITGANYQWIDCATNEAIEGATSQSFEPGVSGAYAVRVVQGVCVVTTDCTSFEYVGIEENTINTVSIYPNPGDGLVRIQNNMRDGLMTVNVFNQLGQKVQQFNQVADGTNLQIDAAQGVYYISVETPHSTEVIKYMLKN